MASGFARSGDVHRSATRVWAALVFCFLSTLASAANIRTAGPFSGVQQGGTITVLDDGRIVAFGGGTASIWDPEQRRWMFALEAQRQPRRYLHTATLVGNDRVVFTGGLDTYGNRWNQQTALSSVTIWRPKQNVWEAGPGLVVPRFAHAAVALPNGDLLVIGGTSTADRDEPFGPYLAGVERLSEKTTTARAPMQLARVGHTATLLADGRVIIVGGIGDNRAALASAEIYDPAANTWTAGAPLAHARSYHTASLLSDGRVLITGGKDSDGQSVAGAEIWSSRDNAWHDAGELLAPRRQHVATVLKDGSVLISGGWATAERAARVLEHWHADTNSWTTAGEAPLELRDHHTALMPDGSVLLFGSDLYQRNSAVLVWLPDELEQQHLEGVTGASITELEDGRMLLVGGSRRQSSSASASLYDPVKDRWTAAAPLHFARTGHRAMRLTDGRVLVAGGQITDRVIRNNVQQRPAGEVWDPRTNRWSITDDVYPLTNKPLESPESDELDPSIAPDTRWSGLAGIVTAANGKTYAFRNADLPGRTFPRLEAVWLNAQARRWQPSTNSYVEREAPALIALADDEIMVAGGASAVVQVWNTKTNEWRYTGWLPAPLLAPSILSLRSGDVMLAGRVMGDEGTVICALWNPDTNTWSECGRFNSDAMGQRRAPVLRDLGGDQTLLVYGNERAVVRSADGTWVATKLDFPKSDGMPYPNADGTAFMTHIAAAWNPLESRWADASDVLFIHRHGMHAVRTPERSWLFSSRGSVLKWQPRERLLTRLSLTGSAEGYLDVAVPIENGCAAVWNDTRELASSMGSGAYAPVMYARNFTADTWSTGFDAPTAPLRAGILLTKRNTLHLTGMSRDDVGGGGDWRSYQVSCDKIEVLEPAGAAAYRSLYLPTRVPRAKAPEPVSAASPPAAQREPTYIETWKSTVGMLINSARRHFQGTLIFGGLALLLLIRLSARWGTYVVDDDGHAPARTVDLGLLGGGVLALLLACGAPWPGLRTLALLGFASLIVFAAKRLWSNIESSRTQVLLGVPLGACALICALAIGSLISHNVHAAIDSLRDY